MIALLGYGEVGRILAEDLRASGHSVVAYDLRCAEPSGQAAGAGQEMRAHAQRHGVALAATHAAAVREADLVISAVTASQTLAVAESAAPGLRAGTFFLDFNSASPGAKIQAAIVVNAAGGRYVEGAVMTSVPPYRIQVPLLLGGPQAQGLAPVLNAMGFAEIGRAHV